MKEYIEEYIKRVNSLYKTSDATELSYRSAIEELFRTCLKLEVINEQKRINCGAPDLTIRKGETPIAYIETKQIGDGDLDGRRKNKKQFDRYKEALDTIVFTDYLDFHLYKEGGLILKFELAYEENNKIVLNDDAIGKFESLILKLREAHPQRISSSKKLAILMANKAKLIAEAVKLELKSDEEQTGSLYMQLKAFKDVLNKDINEDRFADLYAQTIAYGFFAARIHDESPDEFTIKEAVDLIPETNPFLRQLFQNLAAYNVNKSIAWIVDDLVTIFAATDVKKLRKNFETEFQKRDPMIHFYEDFLASYNPEAKKKYGVFYTPQPVVEFIVRAVDDILKSDFNLPEGLADTSKVDTPTENGISQHRVQILDPATGTGTFLAEVVSRIKERQQPGIWPQYVREHLLPRVYGFEYMIAPYTIAHLKLDMLMNLSAADKKQLTNEDRVNIYLTNSLIKDDIKPKYIFAQEIANEANKANKIKHSAPVMVMLGNPPYAVSSNNKGKDFAWIEELLKAYKKGLNEKNIQPLSDDYIKFIRLAQYYVERTGEGIVAYISNNSFLDGLIHRQMRRELMRCFDDIYILDLHGNNRTGGTAPNGGEDENVFAIMQGVSINIFVKKKNSIEKPAEIHHYDLYGTRKEKYNFLSSSTINSIPWHLLQPIEPNLFFVPKDFRDIEEYNRGFKVDELMRVYSNGIQTGRDELFIDDDRKQLEQRIVKLLNGDIDSSFIEKYNIKDSSSYNLIARIKKSTYNPNFIQKLAYRPFDIKYFYYDENLVKRSFYRVFKHMLSNNIGLICSRQFGSKVHFITGVSDTLVEMSSQPFAPYNVFPLYIYNTEGEIDFQKGCQPNLDETIWRTIEHWVKYGQAYKPLTANEQSGELGFDAEPEEPHFLAPEDIFDYIYGVLHSPLYREKYKEFLKVDFPRIPYPKNADEFEHYKECGHQLRELHLMHNVPESSVSFDEPGNCKVEQIRPIPNIDDGYSYSIYINDKQFFAYVPTEAWEMYIGGYQPAQKWLKDRKGRVLSTEDILHYEKIISVLLETKRIMDTMDDPAAQLDEYKKKVHALENQLYAQQSGQIINYGTININDNSTTLK